MEEKVLLVEDKEKFLGMMAERIRARGMQVSMAASATEDVWLAEEQSLVAIVLGLKMPEKDGIEILKLLKKKDPMPGSSCSPATPRTLQFK